MKEAQEGLGRTMRRRNSPGIKKKKKKCVRKVDLKFKNMV